MLRQFSSSYSFSLRSITPQSWSFSLMWVSFFPISDIPKSESQLNNRFPETFLNEGFSWGVAGFYKGSPSCDIALVVSASG